MYILRKFFACPPPIPRRARTQKNRTNDGDSLIDADRACTIAISGSQRRSRARSPTGGGARGRWLGPKGRGNDAPRSRGYAAHVRRGRYLVDQTINNAEAAYAGETATKVDRHAGGAGRPRGPRALPGDTGAGETKRGGRTGLRPAIVQSRPDRATSRRRLLLAVLPVNYPLISRPLIARRPRAWQRTDRVGVGPISHGLGSLLPHHSVPPLRRCLSWTANGRRNRLADSDVYLNADVRRGEVTSR